MCCTGAETLEVRSDIKTHLALTAKVLFFGSGGRDRTYDQLINSYLAQNSEVTDFFQ